MSFKQKISLVVILIFTGCDNNTGPDSSLPPLPDDAAVYLSVFGTEGGLWIFNANSLEIVDSMITAPDGVPSTVEFSPDNSTWYSSWGRGTLYSIFACNLKPLAIKMSARLQYAKYALIKSYDEKYLIAFGYKGIDIFDRETLSLIHQDTSSSFDMEAELTSSHTANRFYFAQGENRKFIGIGVYSLDSMKVIETIRLFNNIEYPGLTSVDIECSPDDKFLYLSAFNWRGLGGFGSFFIIDLTRKVIIDEFRVGSLSQLAVSPDGRSVYISDPAGYLLDLPGSGNVWKYDVQRNLMQVLIRFLYHSDKIAVAEDNKTLFISASPAFNINGEQAWLVKANALNGNIIKYFPVTYDSNGYFTNGARNVRMGRYSIISKRR